MEARGLAYEDIRSYTTLLFERHETATKLIARLEPELQYETSEKEVALVRVEQFTKLNGDLRASLQERLAEWESELKRADTLQIEKDELLE